MRPLSTIARDIAQHWPAPYFGAVPYLGAMMSLDKITDNYDFDSGKSVVLYFLSNAKLGADPTPSALKPN